MKVHSKWLNQKVIASAGEAHTTFIVIMRDPTVATHAAVEPSGTVRMIALKVRGVRWQKGGRFEFATPLMHTHHSMEARVGIGLVQRFISIEFALFCWLFKNYSGDLFTTF